MNEGVSVTFTVATVNVNGMRAAARKGMGEWIASCGADVVTFQEVRAPEDLVEGLVGQGWRSAAHASMLKGRAGVAVAVREGLEGANVGEVRRLLPNLEADSHTGRWLELDVEDALGDGMDLTVISMYMHSGNVDKPQTMADKYEMLEGAWSRLEELRTSGRHVLLTGDLNIAHTNLDIKNWKGNLKSAGFLPEERAYIDRLLEAGEWVDVHRTLAGDVPGPYTWWSQRGKAFDNDSGWRIDYHLASKGLAARAVSARVDRAASYDTRWSDHAPLVVTYE